ncbi:MAG: aldo/keto reductase [Sumerlaeia bacterium]
MEQRDFGKSGLRVSVVGFGAGHIGSPDQSEVDVERLLGAVLDAGCTLIDTARGYGMSEERIGRHLKHRRDEFVLSSKCGYGIDGHGDWTAGIIEAGVDEALRLLQTDRIDIMHLHSCPKDVLERGEVAEALNRCREKGKIRVAAYSGENDALQYAIASGAFGSVQFSVNLCDQRSARNDAPMAKAKGMGVIGKRPIANAFWRFDDQPHGQYAEEYWLRAKSMGLRPPDGLDWDEFALRFAAFHDYVDSVIVGTSKTENFARNAQIAARGALSPEIVAGVRHAFSDHDNNWVGQV